MMMTQSDASDQSGPVPLDVVLCIGPEVYGRLRPVLRHLCVGLIDSNVAVRVATPSPGLSGLTFGPIQMLTYPSPAWPARLLQMTGHRQFALLLDKLAERPPKAVHAVSRSSYRVGLAVAHRFDIDLVLQLTDVADVEALTPALTAAARRYIAASQPLRDMLEQRVDDARDRTILIRPGMLAGAGPTCLADPDRIPAILCTASFRPNSGLERLLHAARILKDRERQFLVFLTGSGPLEAPLRKQTQRLGLDDSVIFARPTGNADSIMIGADIFVQPATRTALTAGPLHALANGMAAIAVEGGVPDLFIDGVTALVCPSNAPDNLADAIDRLLADRDFATRLAQGAVDYMKTHHAISSMVEKTVETYRDLALRRTTFSLSAQASGPQAADPDR